MTYVILIEIYVVLSVVNAFVGVGQGIYQDEFPTENFRSPFNQAPLPDSFVQLDTDQLTEDLVNPVNETGGIIPWANDFIENFEAMIDILLEFTQFFTAGFLVDMLDGLGFPGGWLYVVLAPTGIYTAYMVLVLVTNRLGN